MINSFYIYTGSYKDEKQLQAVCKFTNGVWEKA